MLSKKKFLTSTVLSLVMLCAPADAQKPPAFVSAVLAELLQVCSQLSIAGDLTVCGTISPTVAQGVTGPQGPTGAVGPQGPFGSPCCNNYVYAYHTESFLIADGALMPFNTNGPIDGWLHTPGSTTFTCTQTGRYRITYDGQASLTFPSNVNLLITARINGTSFVGSNLEQAVYRVGGGAPLVQVRTFSKSFLININASDTLDLRFFTTAIANRVQMEAVTTGSTVSPAFSVSITRVE